MLFIRSFREGDHFDGIAPEPGKGLYYLALDQEALVGWCRWRLSLEKVQIEEVEDGGDPMTFDGLVRAVLAAALDQGIDRAHFSEKIRPDRLAVSLIPVYSQNNLISIDYFLNHCKKCKML